MRWKDLNGTVHGPITATDLTSIGRYGRRYAQILLDRADLIRSDTAATNFLNAALADNKEPFATHKVEMPIYPVVRLNDIHTYEPNFKDYDTELRVAVVGYQHTWSSTPGSMPKTTIAGRVAPIAAYREYRLSRPPRSVVATTAADDDDGMPEGTVHYQVTDVTP